MRFSSLIGKPVISPAGEAVGYVTDARLTKEYAAVSCLVCADGDEEEFYLPRRAVLSFGDAVVAGRARLSAPTGMPSPVGAEAYSATGEALGNVADLLFGEGSEPFLVLVKEGVRTTAPVSCAVFGARVMIYPDPSSRPAKRSPRSPVRASAPSSARREALPADPPHRERAAPADGKSPLDRTNLLGKKVKRDVIGRDGKTVASAGDRVTPALLSAARRANCLLQLTVNTLTNCP